MVFSAMISLFFSAVSKCPPSKIYIVSLPKRQTGPAEFDTCLRLWSCYNFDDCSTVKPVWKGSLSCKAILSQALWNCLIDWIEFIVPFNIRHPCQGHVIGCCYPSSVVKQQVTWLGRVGDGLQKQYLLNCIVFCSYGESAWSMLKSAAVIMWCGWIRWCWTVI